MSAVDFYPQEEEFIEAQKHWCLDKLYLDLASAKTKALTPLEKKLLRGLLCGYSPAEIAKRVYNTDNSGSVRVYLSNGVYKYIEDMLTQQLGYAVKLKNWSHVTNFLEKAGYKQYAISVQEINSVINNSRQQENKTVKHGLQNYQSWGEAVDITSFCGRNKELTTVSEWIIQNQCKLVTILGMVGIGKTVFSIKLSQEIADQFDYVIWRSLHLKPSLDDLLSDIMAILSPNETVDITANVNVKISRLMDLLSQFRCLLVLDDFDAILSSNYPEYIKNNKIEQVPQICYQSGFDNYGELIRRIGNCQHQSCLLITSRETPPELAEMVGDQLPVRTLTLTSLGLNESLTILESKGLNTIDYTDINILIDSYGGHPLFLKLVTNTINNLFDGNIYQFLQQGTLVFGDIHRILEQHFNSLSDLEKYLIYWLVLNSDLTTVLSLTSHIVPGCSPKLGTRLTLEGLELLQRRSFINIKSGNISISNVWHEYISERLKENDTSTSLEIENSFLSHDQKLYNKSQETEVSSQEC